MAGRETGSSPLGDLATTCFTCKPLQEFVDLTDVFADKVQSGLHDPILILFGSLAGLWIVWSGVKLVLHMTDMSKIGTEFVFISIAAILVGSQGGTLISYVYTSALSVMSGAADIAFNIASQGSPESSGYTGVVRLAANGELAVAKVIQVASAIARAGALYNIANYVYAVVLVVPYFLLVVSYSSQVVVAVFRVTLVAIFAPFLSLAFGFNWGRPMFQSGCKTLLGTVLVLFACTVALALTIFGVSHIDINPSAMSSGDLNDFASADNPKFLMILFLGWMGTALMTEGTSLANSIAQTALTNAAAGIMTAGAAASAMMLAKTANPLNAGRRAGKALKGAGEELGAYATGAGAAWSAGKSVVGGAANLVNKFKNINTPGGTP